MAIMASGAVGRPLVERWPFVGRHVTLEEALSTVDPPGCGLVVAGRAGVGKTRFVAELGAVLEDEGHRVLGSVASATVATVPLGALAHLLPGDVILAETGDGAVDPVRLLARAREAFGSGDGRSPVVIVDDAHLLDAVSITLLTQLALDGAAALVLTVRAGEPEPDGVAALWRTGRLARIELEPLPPDAVNTLVHMGLGGPLEGRTAHTLRSAAAGNPLLLRELVRSALHDGALRRVEGVWRLDGPLPPARRAIELLGARLEQVGAEAREVLELLALLGPTPLDRLPAETDLGVLEDLEEAELVELRGEAGSELLALTHPLLEEAVRGRLPALRARRILVSAADRAERDRDGRPEDLVRIASWRIEAGVPVAPALLESAASLARYADDMTLTHRLAAAALRARPTLRAALLTGESAYELGRWDEAEEVLAAAQDLPGDAAVRVALLAARTTNLIFGLLRPDRARELTAAALEADDSSDPDIRSELTSRLALVDVYDGRPAAALRLLGPHLAERAPDDGGDHAGRRARVVRAIAAVPALALAGRTVEAAELARAAYGEHEALRGEPGLAGRETHLLTWCLALQEHGDLEGATAIATAGYEGSVQVGSLVGQTWFALNLGRIALLAGHPATGARWYRDALAASAASGWQGPRRMALAGLAAVSALRGDVSDAEQSLADASSPGSFDFLLPERCLGAVWTAVAKGQHAAAREALAEAADLAARTGHLTVESWLRHELARLGDPSVQGRLAELARTSESPLLAARAAQVAAQAARDASALADAAERLAGLGCDLVAAEAMAEAAALARQSGEPRLANGFAARSSALASRCEGARSPRLARAGAASALTPRELEIATLAATRATSRAIAEQFVLSVRTVDNHLQNVYTKLGVSSRAELAAALGAARSGSVADE